MNWCSSIPLGSLGRPGHLHIRRPPSLSDTHTYDEAHDLTAMLANAARTLVLFDTLFDFVEHEVGACPIQKNPGFQSRVVIEPDLAHDLVFHRQRHFRLPDF